MSRWLAGWLVERLVAGIDGLNAWIDRLSLGRRRIVFAVVAVAFTTTVVLVGASASRSDPEAHPASSATVAPVPATAPGAAGSTPPAVAPLVMADGRQNGEGLPLPAADLASAERVTAAFVREFASVRYDEPPEAVVDRVRPYVSDAFAERLLADLQLHGSLSAEADREEITEAEVDHVHAQVLSEDRVTLVVVAHQRTRTVDGQADTHPSFTVRLHRHDDGWRVDELVF